MKGTMKRDALRVGIAGYGIVGKRRRQFIDIHSNLKTVAVCDQNFAVPEIMTDGIKAFSSYDQLLNEPLDILFVCLPNYLAADVTIAGLERGLHVFCEKPPGRNVADIARVRKVEKMCPHLLLKYGFNHRYHGSVQEALKIIQSGELGEIINLRGVYGKSKIIPFSGGWRSERRYAGGGVLLDQGIHMVDLMRLYCGDVSEIKSIVTNDYWNHDVEDNAYALMRNARGQVAILHSTATQWQHRFILEITLRDGYLELRGILSGSKSYGEEQLIIGRRDESDVGTLKNETIKYLEDHSWRDEIFEFAESILNGTPVQSGTSEDALKTMELVYRIYSSDPEWKHKYNIQ